MPYKNYADQQAQWKRWAEDCKKDPVKNKIRTDKQSDSAKKTRRQKYKGAKDRPCQDCKRSFDPVCMDFDHVSGDKIDNIATMVRSGGATNAEIAAEIAKCHVVCSNCHRLRTKLRGELKRIGYIKGKNMLAYIAHPVGNDPEKRKTNLENVQKWFLWLLHHTDFAFNVPWFIYVSNLDESYRERAMRDDLTNLDRCDAIILTGGEMSPGMKVEATMAQQKGLRIIDLTSVGYEPADQALDLIPQEFRK